MTEHKLSLTAAQQQRVLGVIRAGPDAPVGDHLADDDAIGYATGTLTAEAAQHVERHLESCPECAEMMEAMLDAEVFWNSPEGDQRLNALGRRLLGKETVRVKFRPVVGLVGRKAAMTSEAAKGRTEDGRLRWRLEEQSSGDLVIRFGSHDLALEGGKVVVRCGSWQAEVVLRRAAPDQVGADLIVSAPVRQQLPAETTAEVLLGEGPLGP